jgi:hypothetical protein
VKLRIAFITLSLCMLGLGLLLQYEMRFMAPTTFTDAHGRLWKLKENNRLPWNSEMEICAETFDESLRVEYRTDHRETCGDIQSSILHELMHVCLGTRMSPLPVDSTDADAIDVHGVIYLLAPCQYDIFKNNPQLKRYIFQ